MPTTNPITLSTHAKPELPLTALLRVVGEERWLDPPQTEDQAVLHAWATNTFRAAREAAMPQPAKPGEWVVHYPEVQLLIYTPRIACIEALAFLDPPPCPAGGEHEWEEPWDACPGDASRCRHCGAQYRLYRDQRNRLVRRYKEGKAP